ncbi:hypothetical protein PRIPAC_73805 [Pristionchus pacificus]|uniref:Uncharacterized protein n=1 Tax=Pristionchus pacificus TaxID=54126 RepID=A0A2A6CS06_PRIPA|nr:hypothetical protein PRIPAC_73805 [Pristionchus pacificus]|eukprot:PDM80985.1 hypothetical protein PRIPAC_35988 [Pristionchus pacificus]
MTSSARFVLFLLVSTVTLSAAAPNREKRGIVGSFVDPFAAMMDGITGPFLAFPSMIPGFSIVIGSFGQFLVPSKFIGMFTGMVDGIVDPLMGGIPGLKLPGTASTGAPAVATTAASV